MRVSASDEKVLRGSFDTLLYFILFYSILLYSTLVSPQLDLIMCLLEKHVQHHHIALRLVEKAT